MVARVSFEFQLIKENQRIKHAADRVRNRVAILTLSKREWGEIERHK
jgi:hypothetical protein